MVTKSSPLTLVHILMRRSSLLSRSQAEAWQTTSRPSRADDLAALPEGRGQRREAERGVEALADLDHVDRGLLLGLEQIGDVIADVAGALGRDDVVDIAPFLRPHIAEQIGADRAGRRLDRIAIFLVELGPGVAMELVVERLDLGPQPVVHRREFLRASCHIASATSRRCRHSRAPWRPALAISTMRAYSRRASAGRHSRASSATFRRARPGCAACPSAPRHRRR